MCSLLAMRGRLRATTLFGPGEFPFSLLRCLLDVGTGERRRRGKDSDRSPLHRCQEQAICCASTCKPSRQANRTKPRGLTQPSLKLYGVFDARSVKKLTFLSPAFALVDVCTRDFICLSRHQTFTPHFTRNGIPIQPACI